MASSGSVPLVTQAPASEQKYPKKPLTFDIGARASVDSYDNKPAETNREPHRGAHPRGQRLRFVRKAQALGFNLDEIGRILSLRGRCKETCRCVVSIAEATLAETDTKLKKLQKFRYGLAANLKHWRGQVGRAAAAEFCALIEDSGSEASADGK